MEWVLYIGIGIASGFFWYLQNKRIVVKKYRLSFPTLPGAFDGFTIVQLSDLHNKRFGTRQERLIRAVREAKPDIIVITGDIVDSIFYRLEPVRELVGHITGIAPVYYASGNHEFESGHHDEVRKYLIDAGVVVLGNDTKQIVRKNKTIVVAGIDDYKKSYSHPRSFKQFIRAEIDGFSKYGGKNLKTNKTIIETNLRAAAKSIESKAFRILLAHRPEWFLVYAEYGFHLIFSGHAHGGQWNLPLIGPVFAPGQGLFPKLVAGIYRRKSSTMVVSRGIGNSGIAFLRLFNRPEVVVTTIYGK